MDKETKVTLEQIRADIKNARSRNKSLDADDENLLFSANNENDETEYMVRNVLYSNILYEYIEEHKLKNKTKKCYKFVFFVITMSILIALVAVPLLIIKSIALSADETDFDLPNGIALIVSSIAGTITAVAVLPKIIAEHLFPTDEETHLIEMIKNMQSNDSGFRESNSRERS